MTTAHRPQDRAMRGGGSDVLTQGGYFTGGCSIATSARDLNSHLALKVRQPGQSDAGDVAAKDLRAQLEARERAHFDTVRRQWERKKGVAAVAALGASSSQPLLLRDDAGGAATVGASGRRGERAAPVPTELDDALAAFDDADDDEALDRAAAADAGGGDDGGGVGGDDEDDDDDEDDEQELLRELERIKREREEERARREAELAELAARDSTEAILRGNPLLTRGTAAALGSAGSTAYGDGGGAALAGSGGGGGAVKRRFGDDTVFSHTHANEPEQKKRFLNDSLRSDFHRSFMRRFFH